MREKQQSIKNDTQEADPVFEKALESYIDGVVAVEKENYLPSLRPFSAHEREIRTKLSDIFHFFHTTFAKGYRTLIEELQREMATSETKDDLLAMARIDPKKLEVFDDPDALTKAVESGNSICDLLGFTEQSLNVFHRAAYRMIENKAFDKARDVSYFLVTIAPWASQFWVCLGRCDVGLQNFDVAIHEFAQAIEINPTESTSYQELVNLLIEAHEFKQATRLCETSLQFVAENEQEPWAAELRMRLEEKLHDIRVASRGV